MRTLLMVTVALLAACGRGDARLASDRNSTNAAGLRFAGAPHAVTAGAAEPGSAPTVAVAPDGRRAVAWVTAPGGGSDGRLRVAVVNAAGRAVAPAAELRDPLGPIEPHGEAPPKVAFGPGGALYALWVVGKDVPGRRFPLSALRFARSVDDGGGRARGARAPARHAHDAGHARPGARRGHAGAHAAAERGRAAGRGARGNARLTADDGGAGTVRHAL